MAKIKPEWRIAQLNGEVKTLKVLLDQATKSWIHTRRSLVAETSSDITADYRRSLVTVNEVRKAGGLEPLQASDIEDYPGQLTENA